MKNKKLLNQILFDVIEIFDNNNIDYFLVWGTLLGSVRHNGMIPWDNDVDIGFVEKDTKKIRAVEKKIEKKYKFKEKPALWMSGGFTVGPVGLAHLDMVKWKFDDKKKKYWCFFSNAKYQYLPKYKNEEDNINKYFYIDENDLFPLSTHKYYTKKFKVPNNYNKILKDWYGDDCLTHGYSKNGKIKTEIKGSMYESPAEFG